MYYTVAFVNERFLGITLEESNTACCGAPASGYFSHPFVFDMGHKKLLTINDLIKPDQMQAFQKTIIALAKMDDQLLPSSVTALETAIKDIGSNSFQLTKENVAVAIPNVGVHSSNNVFLVVDFKRHSSLFKEEFLNAVNQN
ncbi:hypothetical protein [Adhaeribacter soli]|uniref:Uncharacterized protein n=1 Tax=Adhaeribacter soli TaxID=2607655 RepID=A0A5N1J1T7_9BACT|nr:hypothetical protein [Adhaeribacter soli]KAA9340549.1 hypothetical protein F0P94_03735 [Adhaeribacter soli]